MRLHRLCIARRALAGGKRSPSPAAENGGERSAEKRSKAAAAAPGAKRGRVVHSAAFKLRLVREALLRPPENRIKPTCRRYPSVEPCQLRKWINARANLEKQAREARAAAGGDLPDDYF